MSRFVRFFFFYYMVINMLIGGFNNDKNTSSFKNSFRYKNTWGLCNYNCFYHPSLCIFNAFVEIVIKGCFVHLGGLTCKVAGL